MIASLPRAVAALALAVPLVSSPASADPAHDPKVDCSVYWRTTGVLVFVGYATAASNHVAPKALTVTCTYYNEAGRYTSVNTAPGYAVATFGSGLLGAGRMVVCSSAVALYDDGHVGRAPETCTS